MLNNDKVYEGRGNVLDWFMLTILFQRGDINFVIPSTISKPKKLGGAFYSLIFCDYL